MSSELSVKNDLTMHRPPLNALTGIRFFAAAYVVVCHVQIGRNLVDHGHLTAGTFCMNGYLAVPLFFILSGFILAYTYKGQIESRGGPVRFWEARFARIWPTYVFSLIAMSIPDLHFPPPLTMLACIFMVQSWIPWAPEIAGAWNYVCWTLSLEAFFYLVFPWFQVWLEQRNPRAQKIFVASMLLLCVVINSASWSLGQPEAGIFKLIPRPILHLGEFFVGVGLGNIFLQRMLNSSKGNWFGSGAWTYVASIAAFGLLCLPPNRLTSLVVVVFAALIYGLIAETTLLSRFLSTRAIVFGGTISYAMYLMQTSVREWILMATRAPGHTASKLSLILSAPVLLLVSALVYWGVENPSRRVLRSLFARLRPPISA